MSLEIIILPLPSQLSMTESEIYQVLVDYTLQLSWLAKWKWSKTFESVRPYFSMFSLIRSSRCISTLLQQQTLIVQLLHSVPFLALSLSLMVWHHCFVVVKPYMAFSLT